MNMPAWLSDNSVPVVIMDDTGIIKGVNAEFEKVFAWEPACLLGQPVSIIIPPNFRDAHHMGFSRYLLSGVSSLLDTPLDLEILKGTGETVLARHLISAFQSSDSRRFAAQIRLR